VYPWHLEDQFVEDGSVHEEYDEDDHFVGQRQDCPVPIFWVLCNLYEGYFVVVQPVNDNSLPLWIARAKSYPNCNLKKPNFVMIQYF
jgi:hypothetical protein